MIGIACDRTRLSQDDVASATVTVRNNLPKVANMVRVDLGIPPGFDLLSEDLQPIRRKVPVVAEVDCGSSVSLPRKILYFDSIEGQRDRHPAIPSSSEVRHSRPIRHAL